ncbi:hypothetical protein cce_5302 (plasmid) [Crocosphaera subtropica ATCC 51142]|uniref:Uncharacterized protein n=1 Tax=Crocosphaera subtropica (strain ATCC 51142 / BH68) TaxID=43989 RepID=B1X3D7_CROS5|nr:hypothetical protein [Crocosphaera subtropica]ACB54648.1 hypothetical protein cce_5302 [Crocosphaera subtropica ATCC 51142]
MKVSNFKKPLIYLILSVTLVNIFADKADAFKLELKRVGEWDQMIFNPFTGNKIGTITVPHFRLEKIEIQLGLNNTGKVFLDKGVLANNFLEDLGEGVIPVTMDGQEIAFDNTMFPDIPGSGFTTDTNNGTNFLITFDEPFTEPVGSIVDVSDMNILISTPLNVFDTSLVEGSVFNSAMTDSEPAEIVSTPEKSVSSITLLSLLGVGMFLKKKVNV